MNVFLRGPVAGERLRGRLAPSPTGALHLGNARSFLLAWLSIRSRGGSLVFRMEDLDHPKVKPWAAEQAVEDLRWLGLDWDEGGGMGGACGPYVQSERVGVYRDALARLRELGVVYPCVCSRRDVEAAQSAPHAGEEGLFYPGTCRGRFASWEEACAALPAGRLPAWRFKVGEATEVAFIDGFCGDVTQRVDEAVGDFVLARHAEGAGYMLAVVCDDAAMGITEVLRGDDLLSATPRQLLLYRALGLAEPEFVHVPLVVAPDGRRLAKRHGDTRIAWLREQGMRPEQVLGLLGWWCGLVPWGEAVSVGELLAVYALERVPRSPAVLSEQVVGVLGG